MKYFEIICSNEYCGCDEEFYIKAENYDEAEKIGAELLTESYSFYYPDERFLGIDFEEATEEEIEEEKEYYQQCCDFSIREITKEEYLENEGE